MKRNHTIDQYNIETEEEFDQIFSEYLKKENHLFRGVREVKWRLYSSLQRNWLQSELYDSETDYADLLHKIVENGRNNHVKQIQEIIKSEDNNFDNDAAIMSYLQHYGCPTPLLDWSFDVRKALFFGLKGI